MGRTMSASTTVLPTPDNGNGGNRRMSCPIYGCKRVYTDPGAMENHKKDHEMPTESVPGKMLLCSTIGCSGSFPNMQKLMEHMRHHYKPNIFFQCESCRTKLRSYRGLLTHLHTCSKVSRGKTKPAEPTASQPAATAAVTNPDSSPQDMDQDPPQLESISTVQPLPSQAPNPDGTTSAAVPHPDTSAPPQLGPPILPLQETSSLSPQQLTPAAHPPLITSSSSNVAPSLTPEGLKVALDPQGPPQPQTRSPEAVQPAPGSAPHSPTGSSAVWKKKQGVACKRRILWEHTRGRYTCVQCGHITTNRKEMTQHVKSQHSGNKAAEGTGSSNNSSS